MMVIGPSSDGMRRAAIRVSILVLLDDGHRERRGFLLVKPAGVSILVLLDDGHRVGAILAIWASCDRFQSLFFWMMVIGNWRPSSGGSATTFQSLFFWMMVIGRRVPVPGRCRCTGFQSLFFWMMVIGKMFRLLGVVARFRFNPCSSG